MCLWVWWRSACCYKTNVFVVQHQGEPELWYLEAPANMNQDAAEEIRAADPAHQHFFAKNEHLALGTSYRLRLDEFAISDEDEANFENEELNWFLARLPVSTTLTELDVVFTNYELAHQDNHRVVQPICECMAKIRPEKHPLRRLELCYMVGDEIHVQLLTGALQLFLVAAKQCGIAHLRGESLNYMPIEFMVEFCHDNRHLNVLELENVCFTHNVEEGVSPAAASDPTLLTLDELFLSEVQFANPTIATSFFSLAQATSVSALGIGNIICRREDDEVGGEYYGYDDSDLTSRIVSELVKPSVQRLSLRHNCQIHHFQAALNTETGTFLSELDASIDCDFADALAKVNMLRRFMSDAVQLQHLTVFANPQTVPLLRSLVETLEACTTITRLEVGNNGYQDDDSNYSVDDKDGKVVQQLRRVTARNERLAQFIANPNTYRNDQLLNLMRQFDNCPTGRYRLACSLPGVFSFQTGHSLFPQQNNL